MELQDLAESLGKNIKAEFRADDFIIKYDYYNGIHQTLIIGDIEPNRVILGKYFSKSELLAKRHNRKMSLLSLDWVIRKIAGTIIPIVRMMIYTMDIQIEINFTKVKQYSQLEIYSGNFTDFINSQDFSIDILVIVSDIAITRTAKMTFCPEVLHNKLKSLGHKIFIAECCLVLDGDEPILVRNNYELSMLAENSDIYILMWAESAQMAFIEMFIPNAVELLEKCKLYSLPLAMAAIHGELE